MQTNNKAEIAHNYLLELIREPLTDAYDGQTYMRIARRVKGLGGELDEYKDVIEDYSIKIGNRFLDVWSEVERFWSMIRFPDSGRDGFEWAAEEAEANPIPMPSKPPASEYAIIGSIAWHLACGNPDEPFLLPVKRIAQLCDCNRKTASNIIKWLKRVKVIVCVDESYHYGNGKGRGKKYRLAGSNGKANTEIQLSVSK